MKVSVVILNWNGKPLLKKCLPSVINATKSVKGESEIIVVDNGSEDGSVEFIKNKYPKIKIVSLEKNLGISPGYNVGAKKAKGDVLVLLNNDIMLKKDSIITLLKQFKDRKVFAVAPKLLKWDKTTVEAEFFGMKFIFGTLVFTKPNFGEKNKNEFKTSRITGFVPGGASAIDRKKFLELMGFDEIFAPYYWEDVDLSYRAYKRGWVCVYEPKSVFYHKHAATLKKRFKRRTLHLQELKARYIFTWANIHDNGMLFRHVFWLPAVLMRSAFLSQYRSHRFLDIIALFQAMKKMPDIISKRKREFENSKLSDKEVFNLINSNKANEIASIGLNKFFVKSG